MKKSYPLSLLFLFVLSTNCTAAPSLPNDLKQIQQTCQCPKCHLAGINLSHFQPGSNNKALNPFARSAKDRPRECWFHCNFAKANLTGANLQKSNFTTCIRGYRTPLAAASFVKANLSYADLSHSKFFGVNFAKANLSHAYLKHSRFFLVDFHVTNFAFADLSETNSRMDAMHGWGTDFSQANFSHASLDQADLYGNFRGANFSYANLQHAKLSTSYGAMTPISKRLPSPPGHDPAALWQGVNFSYANLSGATLTSADGKKADLSKAILCHTIMPNGEVDNRDCVQEWQQNISL